MSMSYVGRSLGTLFRQPETKEWASGLKPVEGRSGGSPSTMAYYLEHISYTTVSYMTAEKWNRGKVTYTQLAKDVVVRLRWIRISTHGALDNGEP